MHRKKPPRGPVGSGRRRLRRSSCQGLRHEIPRASIPQSIGIAKKYRQKTFSTPYGIAALLVFCCWLWHNAGRLASPSSGGEELERMELTILGGSAAGPNPGQGCSGYLVESGTTHVVIDLGSGTFPELRRHVDYRLLDGVVLSHGHLDHFLDILSCVTPWHTTQSRRTGHFGSGCLQADSSFSIGWPKRSRTTRTRKSFFRCSRRISTTQMLCSESVSCNSDFILPCITFPAGRCAFQTVSTATCSTPPTPAPRQTSRCRRWIAGHRR